MQRHSSRPRLHLIPITISESVVVRSTKLESFILLGSACQHGQVAMLVGARDWGTHESQVAALYYILCQELTERNGPNMLAQAGAKWAHHN